MQYSPYILLIFTSLFFSLNIIIGKLVTGTIPPITLSLLRWLGALIILLPFCWREIKANPRVFLNRWPLILTLGAFGFSFSSIFAYESVRYGTAVNVSFINAFMPIMVAVVGYLLYREPVTRIQLIGFALSLTGVIWIVFQGDYSYIMRFKANAGDLFMLANVLVWPIFPVLYKHKANDLPRLPMLAWMFLAGMLLTIPPAIIENVVEHAVWLHHFRLIHLFGLFCLCIFPSILANQFQNIALKYVSTNKVGIFQSLIPVFASLIAVFFLGEKIYPYHFLGGLLIFTGVFLVVSYGPERYSSKEP